MQSVVLIIVSVVLGVVGQLILKAALGRGRGPSAPAAGAASIVRLIVTNPGIWLGLAVYGVGTFFWLVALSRVELGYAYPFISLSYALILVASWALFGEKPTSWRIFGVFAICIGVYVVAVG